MNFDFSEEQHQLGAQIERILAETAPLSEFRGVLDGRQAYAERAWRALADLGMLGAATPEALGGSGLSDLETCIIAERIGYALAPLPYRSSICIAGRLLEASAPASSEAAELLGAVIRGETIACAPSFAPEDWRQSSPLRLRGTRLTGDLALVPDGAIADVLVCFADTSAGTQIVAVPLAQAACRRQATATLDPSQNFGRLSFVDAEARPLGPADEPQALYDEVRNRAAILGAFEQLGAAERCLKLACDFAKERVAFGRAIVEYQSIRHKLVEVYAANVLARAHAYKGAWALSTGAAELPLAAASAHVAATQAFSFAAQEMIQVHGGIGFTWEHDCHLFYRRARAAASLLGRTLAWKERVVSALEARNAA